MILAVGITVTAPGVVEVPGSELIAIFEVASGRAPEEIILECGSLYPVEDERAVVSSPFACCLLIELING